MSLTFKMEEKTMLKFSIEGASELQLIPDRLINAGYTGRDQVAVQKHVQ